MISESILIAIVGYFVLLLGVAFYTSRNADSESFFIGNRNSNWLLVAFGMIGTSLSGVTFVSVPGDVGKSGFTYFQLVLGYWIGYWVVAFVLLPLYYKLNLTSIYSFLGKRLGEKAHKIGASFFILSRTVGATARLYLVVSILDVFVFSAFHIPFWLSAVVILLLILLYTFQGGVKTIIITDTLQTTGMLLGLVLCLYALVNALNTDMSGAWQLASENHLTQFWVTDVSKPGFFLKQILGGMFITITMTGLDQEMMQKNISVKNLKDSQKNMMLMSAILVGVNVLFLLLGAVLHVYQAKNPVLLGSGAVAAGDDLFPALALSEAFSGGLGIVFVIALISALFPSVDGALTSLTSSFCIDILNIQEAESDEVSRKRKRMQVHLAFTVLFLLMVFLFRYINDKSIIQFIIKFAGITYGPLLGLFAFGILTRRSVSEKWLWPSCLLGPVLTLILDLLSNPAYYEQKLHLTLGLNGFSEVIFDGYKIGPELIVINGLIVFAILRAFSSNTPNQKTS
jgi:Na+/proline symporter